jgi:hypothetical protein
MFSKNQALEARPLTCRRLLAVWDPSMLNSSFLSNAQASQK